MKEKFKKFTQNKVVKTIGTLALIGGTAFAGAFIGIDYSLKHHSLNINLHKIDSTDNKEIIENSEDEA